MDRELSPETPTGLEIDGRKIRRIARQTDRGKSRQIDYVWTEREADI
jgi:hypothetical protein